MHKNGDDEHKQRFDQDAAHSTGTMPFAMASASGCLKSSKLNQQLYHRSSHEVAASSLSMALSGTKCMSSRDVTAVATSLATAPVVCATVQYSQQEQVRTRSASAQDNTLAAADTPPLNIVCNRSNSIAPSHSRISTSTVANPMSDNGSVLHANANTNARAHRHNHIRSHSPVPVNVSSHTGVTGHSDTHRHPTAHTQGHGNARSHAHSHHQSYNHQRHGNTQAHSHPHSGSNAVHGRRSGDGDSGDGSSASVVTVHKHRVIVGPCAVADIPCRYAGCLDPRGPLHPHAAALTHLSSTDATEREHMLNRLPRPVELRISASPWKTPILAPHPQTLLRYVPIHPYFTVATVAYLAGVPQSASCLPLLQANEDAYAAARLKQQQQEQLLLSEQQQQQLEREREQQGQRRELLLEQQQQHQQQLSGPHPITAHLLVDKGTEVAVLGNDFSGAISTSASATSATSLGTASGTGGRVAMPDSSQRRRGQAAAGSHGPSALSLGPTALRQRNNGDSRVRLGEVMTDQDAKEDLYHDDEKHGESRSGDGFGAATHSAAPGTGRHYVNAHANRAQRDTTVPASAVELGLATTTVSAGVHAESATSTMDASSPDSYADVDVKNCNSNCITRADGGENDDLDSESDDDDVWYRGGYRAATAAAIAGSAESSRLARSRDTRSSRGSEWLSPVASALSPERARLLTAPAQDIATLSTSTQTARDMLTQQLQQQRDMLSPSSQLPLQSPSAYSLEHLRSLSQLQSQSQSQSTSLAPSELQLQSQSESVQSQETSEALPQPHSAGVLEQEQNHQLQPATPLSSLLFDGVRSLSLGTSSDALQQSSYGYSGQDRLVPFSPASKANAKRLRSARDGGAVVLVAQHRQGQQQQGGLPPIAPARAEAKLRRVEVKPLQAHFPVRASKSAGVSSSSSSLSGSDITASVATGTEASTRSSNDEGGGDIDDDDDNDDDDETVALTMADGTSTDASSSTLHRNWVERGAGGVKNNSNLQTPKQLVAHTSQLGLSTTSAAAEVSSSSGTSTSWHGGKTPRRQQRPRAAFFPHSQQQQRQQQQHKDHDVATALGVSTKIVEPALSAEQQQLLQPQQKLNQSATETDRSTATTPSARTNVQTRSVAYVTSEDSIAGSSVSRGAATASASESATDTASIHDCVSGNKSSASSKGSKTPPHTRQTQQKK